MSSHRMLAGLFFMQDLHDALAIHDLLIVDRQSAAQKNQ